MAHKHSQSRLAHSGEIRQPSSTARIAGSLASFWTASDVTVAVRWKASDVTAAVRSAHSAATAVAASQAAASCRSGLYSGVAHLAIVSLRSGRDQACPSGVPVPISCVR